MSAARFPMSFKMAGIVAKELAGRPDATAYAYEVLNVADDGIDGMKVTMADVPALKAGPDKGKPNFRRRTFIQERIITTADLEAGARAWAERTDNCVACMGSATQFVRWNRDEGEVTKPCRHCAATGRFTPIGLPS